jgi:hypothetical protein
METLEEAFEKWSSEQSGYNKLDVLRFGAKWQAEQHVEFINDNIEELDKAIESFKETKKNLVITAIMIFVVASLENKKHLKKLLKYYTQKIGNQLWMVNTIVIPMKETLLLKVLNGNKSK